MTSQTPGPFQVHSEARGPHWVAWLTLAGESKPYRSILLVAASQAEAEARAREWGAGAGTGDQKENAPTSS